MAKANRQAVIDEIIKLIKKNTPRAAILAKICENLRIKSRTFDNYWKDANNQYKKLQEIAKEAANKAYVDGKVEAAKDCLMTEKEAQELTTAIARGNLADYMVVKTVEHTPRIQITLKEFIQRKKDEVAFEDEYAASVGLKGAALKLHKQNKELARCEIVRLELELSKNPKARRIIDGPTEMKQVADLDLVKIIADKQHGKIKSLAHTQFGVKVEMYGADAALSNILKMHGSFEKDNAQQPIKILVTRK